MRAARLLSIQMMLEARGPLSARQLAGELEISLRTLYRDIDHLSAAGVPVVAERGRFGGFRLIDGWSTRLTGLTPSEAQAVFLSGLAGPAAQLGLQEPLRRAQLKLLVSLPAAWRDEASKVHSRLHVDPVDWYREPDPVPHLATVADAVWNGRQMSFQYQSWARLSNTTTSPLGLVLKAGTWYFLGFASHEFRTYRVASLQSPEVLQARAVCPKSFDLPRQWQESVDRFQSSIYSGVARVLATPVGLKSLSRIHAAALRAVNDALGKPSPEERVIVRLPIESIETATTQLLTLAPDVVVLEPKALLLSIQTRLRAISSAYAK
jgi:predicted DNA-binding transcriptional regulator YafY